MEGQLTRWSLYARDLKAFNALLSTKGYDGETLLMIKVGRDNDFQDFKQLCEALSLKPGLMVKFKEKILGFQKHCVEPLQSEKKEKSRKVVVITSKKKVGDVLVKEKHIETLKDGKKYEIIFKDKIQDQFASRTINIFSINKLCY